MPEPSEVRFSVACDEEAKKVFADHLAIVVAGVASFIGEHHSRKEEVVPDHQFIRNCLYPYLYLGEEDGCLYVRPCLRLGDAACLPFGGGGWSVYGPLFEAALSRTFWPVDLQVVEVGGLIATPAEHGARLIAEAKTVGKEFPVIARWVAKEIGNAFPDPPPGDDSSPHEPPLGNGG